MGLLLAGVIHSEGVLCGSRETGQQHHPRRRRAGWFSVIRIEGRVPLVGRTTRNYRVGGKRWICWRRCWK